MSDLEACVRKYSRPESGDQRENLYETVLSSSGYRLPRQGKGKSLTVQERKNLLLRIKDDLITGESRTKNQTSEIEEFTRIKPVRQGQTGIFSYFDSSSGRQVEPSEYAKRYAEYAKEKKRKRSHLQMQDPQIEPSPRKKKVLEDQYSSRRRSSSFCGNVNDGS